MNPIIAIEEQVFVSPDIVRNRILSMGFKDVRSPIDGVVYPDICDLMETDAHGIMANMISQLFAVSISSVKINYLFARVMMYGKEAPHKVHCDANMGMYSALIYLTPDDDALDHMVLNGPCKYGTGFYTHKTHGPRETVLNTDLGADHNSFDNWDEYLFVNAKFNRGLIYDSSYYHCAFPTQGFGSTYETGRMVLTVFFSLNGKL